MIDDFTSTINYEHQHIELFECLNLVFLVHYVHIDNRKRNKYFLRNPVEYMTIGMYNVIINLRR